MHVAVELGPEAHIRPHIPQLMVLVRVSTSQPLDGSMSQSARPVSQRSPHTPATQVAVEPAPEAQRIPQPPQCMVLVRMSTSQPSEAIMLQSAKPSSQRMGAHIPSTHIAVARGPVGHMLPHMPQWAAEAVTSTQTPLHTRRGRGQVLVQTLSTHTMFCPQSLSPRQRTQRRVAVLQIGPPGSPTQSALVLQPVGTSRG
jgi:hypothetical protein